MHPENTRMQRGWSDLAGSNPLAWVVVALLLVVMADRRDVRAAQSTVQGYSETARNLVAELDRMFVADPDDLRAFYVVTDRYIPVRNCDVNDVISISQGSRFFSAVFDAAWAFTLSFENERYVVTLGLTKAGEIILPAARTRRPAIRPRKI